jgi:sensor histidine kinase regulating citrate/malate metabolism
VQRANDLQAVQGALQSGDIKGAQKALAAFKQAQNTTPHTISANNAASALEALQAALLLGNLSAAQQAFANLQVQSSA